MRRKRTGKNPENELQTRENARLRTDLAMEEREVFTAEAGSAAQLPGVELTEHSRRGIRTTVLRVKDAQGAKLLRKPEGTYVTLELLRQPDADGAYRFIRALAAELIRLMRLKGEQEVLVVGLGNDRVSYDALGPMTLRRLLVTRHLTGNLPPMRRVSALEPGVLSKTGLESAGIIRAVAKRIAPAAIIAVDSLASREPKRLCGTVQLTDAGVIPGSGVGARRAALTRQELGIPVYAVGVPTVTDASKLGQELVTTPCDVHERVEKLSRLVAGGINLALHSGLTTEQIAQFVELG